MTLKPTQQEVIARLNHDIFNLEHHVRQLRKRIQLLEFAENREQDVFTEDEIEQLILFNQRLSVLEQYLIELGQQQAQQLIQLVAAVNSPLDDYEIEATLYFTLNEQDLECDEDEDNCLATRRINLKHLSRHNPGFGDGQDHKEPMRHFPGKLQDIRHCRLFYDLCTYCYGFEQPKLRLKDLLRIEHVWVDVAVHHQSTLNIEWGEWQKPGIKSE